MFTIHVRMWSNNNIILIFNCGYNLFILITVESPETSDLTDNAKWNDKYNWIKKANKLDTFS